MAKAKRRNNGEGTIYSERDHWRVALQLPGGKLIRQRAATKVDAEDKLLAMRHAAGLGLPVASADRLDVFLHWWLDVLEAKAQSGQKSVNTVDNARWAVEAWITPMIGGKRLRALEPEDVEHLLGDMAKAGMARSSLVRVRSYLGQALAVAERRGKVARNVAKLAEMPATKAPAQRRSLTVQQAERLLEAARGDRLEALYVTGLMLGLRPGELTGLSWDDLDGDRLMIEASMKNERGTLRRGDPKRAGRSRRTLRVPPPVVAALDRHRIAQKEARLVAGPEWVDTGLIFTTPFGTPLDPSNLRHAFAAITAEAGIGEWTIYELRHSAASLMSAAGQPLEVIADVLGHGSTRMLEKHYRHQTRPTIDGHVAVMEAMFGEQPGGQRRDAGQHKGGRATSPRRYRRH